MSTLSANLDLARVLVDLEHARISGTPLMLEPKAVQLLAGALDLGADPIVQPTAEAPVRVQRNYQRIAVGQVWRPRNQQSSGRVDRTVVAVVGQGQDDLVHTRGRNTTLMPASRLRSDFELVKDVD